MCTTFNIKNGKNPLCKIIYETDITENAMVIITSSFKGYLKSLEF